MVTVNDVLDGHVGLDLEYLDRIYLNGYVPNLQLAGQVVSFMTAHLARPPLSPLGVSGAHHQRAARRHVRWHRRPAGWGCGNRER
jgi:hypothetical protein